MHRLWNIGLCDGLGVGGNEIDFMPGRTMMRKNDVFHKMWMMVQQIVPQKFVIDDL